MNILNFAEIHLDEESCRIKFNEQRCQNGVVCFQYTCKEQLARKEAIIFFKGEQERMFSQKQI